MSRDSTMIALDSNAMTYWIAAMSAVARPPADPCQQEKIALARIFFWMPDGSGFNLTPTVEAEYQAIRDRPKLDNHESWSLVMLCPVRPLPDSNMVAVRATELSKHHSGTNDCQIVAECELTNMVALLTCDPRLLKNLSAEARGVQLFRPTEYWERMSVPKGKMPIRHPHSSNPMSQCTWWHW